MGKGRAGNMLGVGGGRDHGPRRAPGGKRAGQVGKEGPQDPMAAKRELLRKLREERK